MPLFDNIVETALSGCYRDPIYGNEFWTAGQRIDPSRDSTFVWRTSNTYYMTVSGMTYTNWDSTQPNGNQACMCILSGRDKWHSSVCSDALCSVCELDISQQQG